MTGKVFKSIFSVSLAVIIVSSLLFTAVLYKYFTNEHNREIQNEAAYIAEGYYSGGTDYIEKVKNANDNTRITLISADGTVIYDSEKDASQMENHADREEVREAIKTGSGESSRYSSTLSEKTYYYALKLNDGDILRVSNVRYSVVSIIGSMLQPVLAVVAVAIILSVILAFAFSKNAVKPINEINLENPEESDVFEELSPLIRKIRTQNEKIDEQMELLKESRLEFEMITENMSEGLIILDGKSNIVSFNHSAEKIFPSLHRDAKQNFLEINRSEAFRTATQNAVNGIHCEQTLSSDGRFYSIFANPVINDGKIMGAVLVILDITEKQEREQLRREFTANVSHELKTPLTSISGYAEIMMNGVAKPKDIKRFSEKIYKESARLALLVGDIIKISQLDEGIAEPERQAVDLYKIAESAIALLEKAAEKQNIKIHLSGESSMITGEKSIIEEMIFNLIDNAVKYNKPNGSIDIFVKDKCFTVKDTGIGISESDLPRVFERFYRADKSRSKEIGGTGLGLSIVKHGAAYHNAEIHIESSLGAGTEISIQF